MATMTYKEQLLHPNWQRKRLEILQRDEFKCQSCSDGEKTLHVHHKQYVKGRLAWDYPNDELVTLCEDCHELQHEVKAGFNTVIAKMHVDGPCNSYEGLALLAGFVSASRFGHPFELTNTAPWGSDPHAFMLGELAAKLGERSLNIEILEALIHAVAQAPRWVVNAVFADAVASLVSRRDEPEPEAERARRL